jgi:hypothetical protein
MLFVGASQVASAQAKVAHINVSELMDASPDMKAAKAQLENLAQVTKPNTKPWLRNSGKSKPIRKRSNHCN